MNRHLIRIVLVGTTHPGNIGSTARAMKTMGLNRLYLVQPRKFPHEQANDMSAGAQDLLQSAVITSSLKEALEGCHLVIGTSARPRDMALPGLLPSECAHLVHERSQTSEVAIVFGREHAGLTNEELLHCHYHVTIPSVAEFSSLNLSQAVQIIAYELRLKALGTLTHESSENLLATTEEVEGFYQHLEDLLIAIDFLKLSNPVKLVQRLRRMFNRIQLEKREVNILRGILSNTQRALKRKEASHNE